MPAENMAQARFNMVEQQIRPWEIFDPRVLNLLKELPREQFVPEAYRHLAYADIEIPLGHGQSMMFPRMEAKLLQTLEIQPGDRVLEIGTGSGFLTACLARLAARVVSIDLHEEFTRQAASTLEAQEIHNVTLMTGDALQLSLEQLGSFDAIAVTGSLPDSALLKPIRSQLENGGRIFAVVGRPPVMQAILVTRISQGQYREEVILETELQPLENAEEPAAFVF